MSRISRLIFAAAFLGVWLPATLAPAASTTRARLDLAGEWRFSLDRASEQRQPGDGIRGGPPSSLTPGDGLAQQWFNHVLTNRIRLPGILQAQGYGDDISVDTPWVLTLGDAWWKLQSAALREHFSQPGRVEVPFLSQPPKHYLGVAWYQRDIQIPAAWQGRHFQLFLERPHWQTTVWVGGQSFPPNDSLVAPHVTDLGLLPPGRHVLSIRIDNRTQLPALGHLVDGHGVSDALGATWNGVAGRIELIATAPVWIEDAQCFPNVTNKSALIKIRMGNATGQPGSGVIQIGAQSAPAAWDATGGQAEIEVPLGATAKMWDEWRPNLQRLTVVLHGPGGGDSVPLVFGLREITADDKNLLLNSHPLNLRMTHDGGDFPLTGFPATDVASWKKIIQVCQAYGLNGMRFHSWCPPEAAFTAADELGFFLQPEGGMWNDFGSPAMQQRLSDETARLLQAYGNHPSFILFSPSNEPRNYQRFTPQWAAACYQKDNRRLYSAGTGWSDPSQVSGPQYASLVAFNRGQLRSTSGWFGRDYRQALDNVHIPVLAHEVGQWCAYPDFSVIHEFTGYLRPGNYDIFRYLAQQQGVLAQNHDFAWASGRFQIECYKEEIEANLRTPGLSGFQLLDLHDYLGQGTALIGIVDAFWQPKSYQTAAQFRRFAGPTVPLARLSRRVFTSDQTLESEVEIYHFGQNPLQAAMPYWKILDAGGKSLAAGQWPARDIPVGKNIPLGKITVDLSKLPAPAACKLVVGLRGAAVENDWNIWLYPAATNATPTPPDDVLVTRIWPEAAARLASAGKVLFIPAATDLDPAKSPPMKSVPVFWNIQMTVRPPANPNPKFDAMLGLLCDPPHPALAEFPTEKNCDWQWTPLVNNVRSVNLAAAPPSLHPIVSAIDDWNRNWRLGVIFECNVGPGRLLVSAINLANENLAAEPGLRQLRRSVFDYMAGPRFKPSATLTSAQVAALWSAQGAASGASPPSRAFDPDLNDGTRPAAPARRQ
jgi:beta-galactosidase